MVAPEFKYETVSRRETKLRAAIVKDLLSQGFYAISVNDRFASGRPDFRYGIHDLGQLDVELKIIDAANGKVTTGLTTLQRNEIRDMNKSGMPAIALTYAESRGEFIIHHDKEIDLDSTDLYVIQRSKAPGVIDGRRLMELAHYYIEQEIQA